MLSGLLIHRTRGNTGLTQNIPALCIIQGSGHQDGVYPGLMPTRRPATCCWFVHCGLNRLEKFARMLPYRPTTSSSSGATDHMLISVGHGRPRRQDRPVLPKGTQGRGPFPESQRHAELATWRPTGGALMSRAARDGRRAGSPGAVQCNAAHRRGGRLAHGRAHAVFWPGNRVCRLPLWRRCLQSTGRRAR